MGSQHIQMLRVALFAALTIVAFGDHGMTTTAAAEPDTTTTVAATTTATAPIAGERRAEPLSAFKCKECDNWMDCDGNHFLAVTKLDGTNGDCARTTGILNPLLSAAGTACHGYRGYEAQTFRRRGYIVNVGYAEVADNCDATADAINQKIAGAAVVAKVACTASGYIGNMLFVPGDITACKPVACALNDVVGAFDPDCPVPIAAPAFTQITQTVVQTVPGVDSAATFNADPNVKSAYQKAYGSMIGITDTDSTTNAVTYKTGCSVDAYATDARRAAMNAKYISVVSDTSGVDTTTASNGVTDTSAFATAVATVVASDTTTSGSVTPPSASDITSVSTPGASSTPAGTQGMCASILETFENKQCLLPILCGSQQAPQRTEKACVQVDLPTQTLCHRTMVTVNRTSQRLTESNCHSQVG